MGREALKYIGETAKEVAGIGAAQRKYRDTMSSGEYDKRFVFITSLFLGVDQGITKIISPFSYESLGDSGHKVTSPVAK